MSLFGNLFESNSRSDDVDWFCDGCDAQLNIQPGFTTATGKWTCTKCGYENDVTTDNILSEEEAETARSFQRECPKCGGHMAEGQGYAENTWVCENCGCEAIDDGYGNLLIDSD